MNFFDTKLISCKPISNLQDLLKWSSNKAEKFCVSKLNSLYYLADDKKPKFLVCHDMKNNYLGDKFFQGSNSFTEYSFYHWNLIDTFIYFSHHFVTIPTESWINAAHENNCRILGTIITEFDRGEKICNQMFENLDTIIEKLVEITCHYGFDGWLVNIENKINKMEKLEYFVQNLRQNLKKCNDSLYQVIWYDSVIKTGELKWQNELNNLNQRFFDISDGIFLNYTWKDHNLQNSFNIAKERFRDVFVGIDVFGRGCHGNGGFNTCQAMEKIQKTDLSYALFAPGWVHECNDETQFFENNQKFWSLLEKYTAKRAIKHLPILSSLSHASGKNFFFQGQKLAYPWNNLNLQSLIPLVENSKWDFEDGFFGASSLCLEKGLNSLFELDLAVNSTQLLNFELVFKTEGDFKVIFENENSPNFELDNDNDQLVVLSKFEKRIQSWNSRKFIFKFKNDVKLKKIKLIVNQNLKLGLIRFFEQQEESQQIKKIKFNPIEMEYSTMKLDNNVYLLIKFNLYNLNCRFYSVFLNKKYANDSRDYSNLCYTGSSKKNQFNLCLKLNKNVFIDSTNESNNDELKFSVLIHQMDELMDSLVKNENILSNTDLVHSFNFEFPLLKLHNNNDFNFVDQIIYDLEFF